MLEHRLVGDALRSGKEMLAKVTTVKTDIEIDSCPKISMYQVKAINYGRLFVFSLGLST